MKQLMRVTAALFTLAGTLAFAQAPVQNDAQIVAVLVAANNVDADAGRMAATKARSKDVKEFAQRMTKDHTTLNREATALVKKLKLLPEESDTSRGMQRHAAVVLKRINRLEGDEFDKAYIDNELTFHQAVLDVIDKSLLPNAKNAALKTFIDKARAGVDAHLQQARQIQSSLP